MIHHCGTITLGFFLLLFLTSHASNASSHTSHAALSLASSSKRWSSVCVRVADSHAKSYQYFCFLHIPPKKASWSASTLALLMWFNKSSPYCLLHVKDLQQTKKNDEHFLVFFRGCCKGPPRPSVNYLQIPMYANALSTKLSTMMGIVFLTHFL